LIVPWFAYETWTSGTGVWGIMLGQHVYTRFTGALDPHHIHPWSYYFLEIWAELVRARSTLLALAGIGTLSVMAWRGRVWLARLVLLWGVLPLVAISFGTSKLFHYAYPFLPPIALGGGYAIALAVLWLLRGEGLSRAARAVTAWTPRWIAEQRTVRGGLATVGALGIATALWTAIFGRVYLGVGDLELFKNGSVLRPILVATLAWMLIGRAKLLGPWLALTLVLATLPMHPYRVALRRTSLVGHPLRALRDCVKRVQESEPEVRAGLLNAATRVPSHTYFYYWHDLGPWIKADRDRSTDIDRRLLETGSQMPVLMSSQDYDLWRQGLGSSEVLAVARPAGIAPDPYLVMLLPGPYEACVPFAVAAGGRPIGGTRHASREVPR
jgi:hypothetical protein